MKRFWDKVDVRGPDECWNWTASVASHGYGQIKIGPGPVPAHRFSLEMSVGRSLETHECALHSCDNRLCVNPRHLRVGSKADNMLDLSARKKHRLCKGSVYLARFLVSEGNSHKSVAEWLGTSKSWVTRVNCGKTRRLDCEQ